MASPISHFVSANVLPVFLVSPMFTELWRIYTTMALLALRRRFYIAVGESTVAVFPGYALSQNKNKTTVSYKTFRENLLIFLNEDLINYETFALLYDIDTSSNLDLPYGIYDTFDLDLICDDEYN